MRYLAGLLIAYSLGVLSHWQLSGPSAHGDQSPTGYTLNDVYDFIVSNGSTNPLEGDHSLRSSTGPGQGGLRTIVEIMVELKKRLPCIGLPATGQTKCYDDQGIEIDCGSVDFPGQDGFYLAGCPMAGRFVDHGDGTVTDNCTGLMWQKVTAPGTYTWQEALQYCEGLDLGSHTNWRLPNVMELHSILDYGRSMPTIDPVFEAIPNWYWTSSSYSVDPVNAMFVTFGGGGIAAGVRDAFRYVRAVRG